MAFQTVFRRYELKYIITSNQKQRILDTMQHFMEPDKYGKTIIRNIYFDTDNYRLIRRSIERPVYKEKLRIRSYSKATDKSIVFVELKKKYEHLVYKRRFPLCEAQAMNWICKNQKDGIDTQISREIDYFLYYYGTLNPTAFLSYEREAYYATDNSDFRVTFDNNILCRFSDISLHSEIYGEPLLEGDKVLMEIKCSGGIPLWMTSILSSEKIYKTSFSKYGTAYKQLILPKLKGDKFYDKHII